LKFYDAVEEWKERNVTIVEDITWDKLLDEFYDELDSICPPDMLDPVTQSYMKTPMYFICMHRFDLSTIISMVEAHKILLCPLCRCQVDEMYYNLTDVYAAKIHKVVEKESENRRSIERREEVDRRIIINEFNKITSSINSLMIIRLFTM
jgi:vacuolar-type H+-ATPase catalytic subunit A/Vma1